MSNLPDFWYPCLRNHVLYNFLEVGDLLGIGRGILHIRDPKFKKIRLNVLWRIDPVAKR
jgi:hypothetical protein